MTPTPWGYDADLADYDEVMPPLITLEQFHELTGNAFSQDSRIESAIAGVSARVRSHCGWHVWPNLACEVVEDGGGSTLWLPSMLVTSVDAVVVSGEPVTCYEWSRIGQLRMPPTPDVLSSVAVSFTSGYDGDACPDDLAALVAHRVMHAVALPFGVQSESSGGVSVSYAASATAQAGGPNLTQRDRDLLATYRIEGAL